MRIVSIVLTHCCISLPLPASCMSSKVYASVRRPSVRMSVPSGRCCCGLGGGQKMLMDCCTAGAPQQQLWGVSRCELSHQGEALDWGRRLLSTIALLTCDYHHTGVVLDVVHMSVYRAGRCKLSLPVSIIHVLYWIALLTCDYDPGVLDTVGHRLLTIILSNLNRFNFLKTFFGPPFIWWYIERGCLMHFARLANTLLNNEESARDNHFLSCNFAKYSLIKKFSLTDRLSNKPFLSRLLAAPPHYLVLYR